MKEIARLTIVTGQGVEQFFSDESTKIIKAKYDVNGDIYDCFNIVVNETITHEIRCVNNVSIEYKL